VTSTKMPDHPREKPINSGDFDATLPPGPRGTRVPPPTEDEMLAAAPVCDRPTLTLVTGPQAGAVYTLESNTVVGRSSECDVRIDHLGVSRRHAVISQLEGSDFIIEDLGSRNGTTVRGIATTRSRLVNGDRIGIGSSIYFRFSLADEAEQRLLRRQYESSIIDDLTGATNRRHLDERLSGEIAYSKRHESELALLLFDIDHFKAINDGFGHPAGDLVLRRLGEAVRQTLRVEDVFARYGGEEFAILVRGIDGPHAMALAERIRALVARTTFHSDGHDLHITVSLGVANASQCGRDLTPERLIAEADRALYRAKSDGRNCSRSAR
jgi:two-component system cell cycle response regulator